jgi:hypothetical protein
MYSATYSNLGLTPAISVYVDEFSDAKCQVCTTCGNSSPIVKILSATTSACSSGVSYQVVSYKSTPVYDGVPQLALNYKNTNYYASDADCRQVGKAPVVITSKFTGDPVTRENGKCELTHDSCAIATRPYLDDAPYYGYTTTLPISAYKPYAPYVSESCASYDLNYLALLALILVPVIIGAVIGSYYPAPGCPGCPDPGHINNPTWVSFGAQGAPLAPMGGYNPTVQQNVPGFQVNNSAPGFFYASGVGNVNGNVNGNVGNVNGNINGNVNVNGSGNAPPASFPSWTSPGAPGPTASAGQNIPLAPLGGDAASYVV